MSLLSSLAGFGLRQVVGVGGGAVAQAVQRLLRDHSQVLPRALQRAHDRAWQALGVALAGDGLLDRVRVFFSSADDRGVREQVNAFLQGTAASFEGTASELRQACLEELRALRKSGRLREEGLPSAEIAEKASSFQRHADAQGLAAEAQRAVDGVADRLGDDYPNLARLLRTPTPGGPSILASAFAYFFRREVETDEELAHGLFFDGLRQLSSSQARAFVEVNKALTSLGDHFDDLFELLWRIEGVVADTHAKAAATHGAVLDLQAELQRLGSLQLANGEEVRILLLQVIQHLSRVGMHAGEVRPEHSITIRGDDERRAVKTLLDRFRRLPELEQGKVPALLNGLGKLQVGSGDFEEARRTFSEVAQVVGDLSAKAEASFNAYRAALEERQWDQALDAARQAAALDPHRFALFPLHRYEPRQVLGTGGFGTAFLCHDRHFAEDVVVKTLHSTSLDRGVDELFREARVLRQLTHPAIIGVRDCDYATPAEKGRPYLVMDYFPGTTLQRHVDEHGPLPLPDLLAVAMQVAAGMKAVHARSVLHRDLKPANILVRKDGDTWLVKIIDFGLALLQRTIETSLARLETTQKSLLDVSVAGTRDYAPPEQFGALSGVKPGPYSDVYAFARTCCYAGFKVTDLRRKHWESLPQVLADLFDKCLEPDPKQRHQGFDPVLAALGQCSTGAAHVQSEEQAQRLLREQEEEHRHQRETEEQLRRLVRTALERNGGELTEEDAAAVRELCRQGKVSAERTNVVFREVRQQWRCEAEEQDRKQRSQPIVRQPQPARPRLVVSAAGDGTHRTIREAIQAAAPGEEVHIRPGTYREGIVLDRDVRLIGDGPVDRIIIEHGDAECLLAKADTGLVRGLTLRGIAAQQAKKFFAVHVARGAVVIEDCDITSDSLACVAVAGSAATPTIRNCRIHDGQDSGVFVLQQGKGTIESCDIFRNKQAGIVITDAADPVVRNCQLRDSRDGVGVRVFRQGKGTLEGCDVSGNQLAGIQVREGGDPTVRNCRVHGTREGSGIYVYKQGKGTIEYCDIFANKLSGIEIKQGGNPTVRKCQVHDSKESCGVYVWEQGKGTLDGCDIFANKLAGVGINQGGDPTLRNCRIHDGQETGVFVLEHGKGTIDSCSIFANKLAGVAITQGGDPVVRNCQIYDSKECGGVRVYKHGKGTIDGCHIHSNAMAGIQVREGGNPTVRKCRVHNSKQSCGVFVWEQGKGTIEDCDIFANKLAGVGIKQGGDPVVRNCLIRDSKESCGVRVWEEGKGSILNCTLSGNTRGPWDIAAGCNVTRHGNTDA
jgi:F-box protein 11